MGLCVNHEACPDCDLAHRKLREQRDEARAELEELRARVPRPLNGQPDVPEREAFCVVCRTAFRTRTANHKICSAPCREKRKEQYKKGYEWVR